MHKGKTRTKLITAVATAAAAATAALVVPGAVADPAAPEATAEPIGYGAGVTVSDADAFTEAVQSEGPLVVEVDGTIELSEMTDVAADKTVVGVGKL